MLWGLSEILRRVAIDGSVRLSEAEVVLMCGDLEGMDAVLRDEACEDLQAKLERAGLEVYKAGGDWFVSQTGQ